MKWIVVREERVLPAICTEMVRGQTQSGGGKIHIVEWSGDTASTRTQRMKKERGRGKGPTLQSILHLLSDTRMR